MGPQPARQMIEPLPVERAHGQGNGRQDAAGGIVTADTIRVLKAKGLSAGDYLADNDAYHALTEAGALVMTGATGTNVADLQVLLLR